MRFTPLDPAAPHQAINVSLPPRARLVPRNKENGQNEDPLFLVFSPKDEQKIYLCPPIFFLPPPPQSRNSGARPGPGQSHGNFSSFNVCQRQNAAID